MHSLRVALNQNGVSTPAAAAKIQLLEQENARLRREFQSLRARLQSGYSSSHSSNTASASDPGSFYADPSYPSSIVQSISPNSSSRNHDVRRLSLLKEKKITLFEGLGSPHDMNLTMPVFNITVDTRDRPFAAAQRDATLFCRVRPLQCIHRHPRGQTLRTVLRFGCQLPAAAVSSILHLGSPRSEP